MAIYQYEAHITNFLGVDLPLDHSPLLPELSERESIIINLKLPLSWGIDVPLDLQPGLPDLSE